MRIESVRSAAAWLTELLQKEKMFDDYGRICFEYMQRCVTREYRYVESIEEAIDWMNRFMNNGG